MSDAPLPTPPPATVHPVDNWYSPQTAIAMIGMLIVAGTVAATFWRANPDSINFVTGAVFGTIAGGIVTFYFSSSAGSQRKDPVPPVPPLAGP